MLHLMEGKLKTELLKIAIERSPHEAVGLILEDGRVLELPNHSGSPEDSFTVHKEDIVMLLFELMEHIDLNKVTLWHSHPSGGVGPSRIDIRNKTLFTSHLVVSIIDGDLVPTWY